MSAAYKSKTATKIETFSSSNSPNLLEDNSVAPPQPDNRKRPPAPARQQVPRNNNPPPVPAARPDARENGEAIKAINIKLVSKDNPALQLDLPTRDKVMITFD